MTAKLPRTIADFFGLSPFESERTNGPDRTQADSVRGGARRSLGRTHRTGTDRGHGYASPFGGASVPVRWVRPRAGEGPGAVADAIVFGSGGLI